MLSGMLVAAPDVAFGQTLESDRIAQQWRDAKRRELIAARDSLSEQIGRLEAGATPDTVASPAISAPAPARSVAVAPVRAAPPPPDGEPSEDDKNDGKRSFGGIDFGVGLSFTADLGERDRISDAALVNGLVRVVDQNNARARIMLESHYFFTPAAAIPGLGVRNGPRSPDGAQERREWGWGPFVAIQPGSDDVIEAIGLGVMVGFRRGSGDQSFNIGLGLVVDPNTRILGDDILANRPLPAGETEIRFQERSQKGILILSSFSF